MSMPFDAEAGLIRRIARLIKCDAGPPLDICPKCGGPTQHVCSWVCVDWCPNCNATGSAAHTTGHGQDG